MTKAQEIRNRRLEKMQSDITAQAEKVFDWMLDLIDADTKKGYFGSIEVCLFDGQNKIKHTDFNSEYDLGNVLLQHDRLAFFSELKQVVEQEEGFKAILKPSATLWDSKCIILQIVIE